MKTFYTVLVAHDSTGPHFEYYETEQDFEIGLGYPVEELEPIQREKILFEIRNGFYAENINA